MASRDRAAVIVGSDINGLGIVRSLSAARVPTVVVDRDLRAPAMQTRFARKVSFRSLEGKVLVEELLALRRQFPEDPVLFLTQERSVATLVHHHPEVARHYRISMPERGVIEPLMHKASFQRLAEEHGFAVPRSVMLHEKSDLDAAAVLTMPCVLKPAIKSAAYDARFKKAYKVLDFAELTKLFLDIAPVLPDLIVQEWIEGGDDAIYFCLQYRGLEAAAATFTGRKLRSWPPRVGGTASCIPAPEHAAELERVTDSFFRTVGFFGMCSMEYKRDIRTGRFVMIEPTVGRTDFQEEVATLNGVNIPLAAYRHECGLPVATAMPGRPAAWTVSQLDRWSREQQPPNNVGFPAHLRIYDAYWRVSDPAPWFYTMKARVGDLLQLSRGRS